ncbi:kinase suppressor of Ras 1 [Scaptodrosophila lebanonensis]|uniref:Kinase suppressor of Ras 1 n=1 Tax=Drosophila lebanonensis TaxID=7225 RepID=A0A6J2TM36_DROLE|nr:kinase suppressor of Ras 1 [Scaptodrosophila lebanonensis]
MRAEMEQQQRNASSSESAMVTTTSSTLSESNLVIIQDMIDLSANHLEGLRTQCATSATLTQQEIRALESKLVRYFSELLLAKLRLNERIPANGLLPHTTGNDLKQWLRVVGLSQESLNACAEHLSTLEQLLTQNDEELKQLLSQNPNYRDEELRRLTKAMQNLRKCMETLENGSGATASDMEQWHWDSWDRPHHVHRGSIGNIGLSTASPRAHHRQHGQKPKTGSNSTNTSTTVVNASTTSRSGRQSPTTMSEQQSRTEDMSMQGSQLTLTLTPSPPNSPFTPSSGGMSSLNGTPQRSKAAGVAVVGTPPPAKKHQTLFTHNATPTHVAALNPDYNVSVNTENNTLPRSRLPTDPSPDSHSSASSDILVDPNATAILTSVLMVPCSPGVGHVGMGHAIKHRFTKAIGFISTCNLCQKQVFSRCLKCTDCKYLCHKGCEPHVPPSCGLPREYVDEFRHIKEQVGFSTLPHTNTHNSHSKGSPLANYRSMLGKPLQQHGDSSSPSSSCTSSTPSSPALFNHHQQQQQQHQLQHAGSYGGSSAGGSSSSANLLPTPSAYQHKHQQSQFNFPNVTITSSGANAASNAGETGGVSTLTLLSNEPSESVDSGITMSSSNGNNNNVSISSNSSNHNHINAITSSQMSNQSSVSSSITTTTSYTASIANTGTSKFFPRKLSTAGVDKRTPFTSEYTDTHKSNDSDKTVSLSGSASTDSDRTPVRLDSTEDGDSGQWRQNSISLKEWDIPYGDLRLLEQIGQGRFGTVHRALWHGDVAVKLLNEDYLQDEHMLETFKNEVANFKKTRHENLVLFMGACMNPPYLAIVTSLCKGNTLYTYIHQRREKFAMNRTLLIAQQIAQGMGYLHARDIIHKDLRTKNIFLENGKVIITDFGLFSSTKLLYCDIGLGIPHNWLCYLAPELIRKLMPRKPTGECLEFTTASDVYSFGTVWYELICGEFTFKDQPAESIIWQVGRGMKQSLANLQSGRDVKDLLMLCWTFDKKNRPEFAKLLTLLEHLPKKRLARSPSHPVNLSRSAESVF